MYKVIIFRSRELKKNTITIAAGDTAADFRDEKPVYMINGFKVNEEDLTQTEKADIAAAREFNSDGFYASPEVIDKDEIKTDTKKMDSKTKIAIGALCALIIVVSVVTIYFVSSLA